MKKDKMVEKMYKLANEITGKNTKNYTWEKGSKLWDMASEWNSTHEDSEIFMCEVHKEDGYEYDGFMIEDDIFYYVED